MSLLKGLFASIKVMIGKLTLLVQDIGVTTLNRQVTVSGVGMIHTENTTNALFVDEATKLVTIMALLAHVLDLL